MLDDLKIDSTTLTHFDYHWFWGLRYSKAPQRVNFGIEVVALLSNEVKLAEVIARQTKLYHEHNAVERYFYWLFNINNYTYQSYVLAACKGYQNYLDHTLEKEDTMPTTNKLPLDRLASFLAPAGRMIQRLWPKTSVAFAKKADDEVSANALVRRQEPSSAAAEASSAAAMSISKDVEVVIVTAAMQPHLAVLGINLQLGDSLKLADFKSSCRARYLAAHPDKGGSDEAFRRVSEAAEALRKIISSQANPADLPSQEDNLAEFWAEFNASMAEVWASLAMDKAKLDAAIVRLDEADARLDEADARLDAAIARLDEADAILAAEKVEHEEIDAALQDHQEQGIGHEEAEKQGLASSSSFSDSGAPGLFAPERIRTEGSADESGAESSPSCR